MTSHSAIAGDAVVVVMGKDAKDVMTAWIEGKISGGLDQAPGMVRARKQAANGAFGLAYGSPLELLRVIKIGGVSPFPQLPAAPPATNGLALSVGTQGGAVQVVLDLPAEQIGSFVQLAAAAKGMR